MVEVPSYKERQCLEVNRDHLMVGSYHHHRHPLVRRSSLIHPIHASRARRLVVTLSNVSGEEKVMSKDSEKPHIQEQFHGAASCYDPSTVGSDNIPQTEAEAQQARDENTRAYKEEEARDQQRAEEQSDAWWANEMEDARRKSE